MALRPRLRGVAVSIRLQAILPAALAALAACGSAPTAHKAPTATPSPKPTATATVAPQPTWTVVTNVPALTSQIVFAPSNPQIAYLCADDGPAVGPVHQTPRLHKSSDSGQTWNLLTAAPPLHPVPPAVSGPTDLLARCDVFVDAADANDVFLQQVELEPVGATFAILRTLYRSRDGGASWSQLGTIDGTDGFTALYVAGGRLIGLYRPSFYGGVGGCSTLTPRQTNTVVASDDGGATWHDSATSIETQGYGHNVLAQAGNTIFTAGAQATSSTCVAPTKSAIWRSADGGRSWTLVTTLSMAYLGNLSFTGNTAGTSYLGVIIAAGDPGASGTPYYSSDGGATWAPLSSPPTGSGRGALGLVALPDGDVLAGSGVNDSIYRLRPSDAHPAWTAIAPGSSGVWQVVSSNGATTLWSVTFHYENSSTVEHLTLAQ